MVLLEAGAVMTDLEAVCVVVRFHQVGRRDWRTDNRKLAAITKVDLRNVCTQEVKGKDDLIGILINYQGLILTRCCKRDLDVLLLI
jgi:hypothetical protein